MPVLMFDDRGWEVLTAAWSAAAKPGDKVSICYQWGADHISFFQSATGISRIEIDIGLQKFRELVARGGVVDLRPYQ